MKNHVIYIILAILLISSCSKAKFDEDDICLENCVIFTGRIIDTPSNKSISGVELKFYYHSLEGSSFLRPPVYLGTKTTEEEGTYTFKFSGEEYLKQGYFTIEGKKGGYFTHPIEAEAFQTYESIKVEEIQYDTPITRDINLYKKAVLELKIKSENVLDFEKFEVYYGTAKHEPGKFETLNGYSKGFNILFNQKIDTLVNINIPVGIKSYVTWQGYNDLGPFKINKTDSLISRNGEKIVYEILL
ncbi:MAG TPA: hypothetical protein VKZ98_02390 [Aquaticitalea sp.]|nr:hypothetical protein [Aquaticitalea sp.]